MAIVKEPVHVITIYRDVTYIDYKVFEDDDKNPLDIAGWTFTMQFRDKNDNLVATAIVTNLQVDSDPTSKGKIKVEVPRSQTKTMPLTDVVTDLFCELPDGTSEISPKILVNVEQPASRPL